MPVRLVGRRPAVAVAAIVSGAVVLLAGCSAGVSDNGDDADAGRGTTITTHPGTGTGPDDGDCADEESNAAAEPEHVNPGTTMSYTGVPPVSGKHWAQWPDVSKTLYVADERPELGEIVHSMEHGWTVVWYDDSVAGDDTALSALHDVASQVDDAGLDKVVIVPWTSDDGDAFPDGKHVAFTHWGNEGDGTEWRQFCATASLPAISGFAERHPASTSFEPDAP
jgi:hypothetical protein